MPGFCFRGIHKINTKMLTRNVVVPMDKLIFNEIPWAKTLQGDAPELDTINNPSPKPNNINPKIKKNKLDKLGFKLSGSFELQ